MAIKSFALQEWCEKDLMVLAKIETKHNWADALTKPQSKLLFHCHMNHIMGNIHPNYTQKMLGQKFHLKHNPTPGNMGSGEGETISIFTPT